MKSSKRQFLVTVSTIPNKTFTQQEGGEKSAETSKWYDGGSTVPNVISAPPETGDVTLTNAFDPEADSDLIKSCLAQIGTMRATITRAPLYGDMTRVASAKPDVYTDAVLKSCVPVEVDANSGDVAVYKFVFSPADLT